MTYRTIVADPPWPLPLMGKRKRVKGGMPDSLPYPTMTLEELYALDVGSLAAEDCHLWLWTTNSFLKSGFDLMQAWGFRYLAPIHWIKPSGVGNYVIHRTQTVLLGYKYRCNFNRKRYFPNIIESGDPVRHSQKPEAAFKLIEEVSWEPRIELFARVRRPGWHLWGNEVDSDVVLESRRNVSDLTR